MVYVAARQVGVRVFVWSQMVDRTFNREIKYISRTTRTYDWSRVADSAGMCGEGVDNRRRPL